MGYGHDGVGGPWPEFFQNLRIFGNFNASPENIGLFFFVKTGFKFHRKIVELSPSTLQVPRRPIGRKF